MLPGMYKIIGGDGREYGPVSSAQISQWIAQNRANGQTMVKPEGATDWLPLAQQPEFASAFASRSAPPPIPGGAEPGLPEYSGTSPSYTAAASAPEPQAPSDRAAQARACAGRPYQLSVMDTLTRGWEVITSNFWLTVGGSFVAMLASGAASSLPFIGVVVSVCMSQVFYAGIYWLLLRVGRGEPAEFADVFAGFSRSFGQLVRLSVVMFLLLAALALLAVGPLLWALYRGGVFSGVHQGGMFSGIHPDFAQMVTPLLVLPVMMVPLLYFSVSWIFAPMLVIDRGLGFWEAMELSRKVAGQRWFKLFFLYLAFIPLMIAGLLCFIVGIFVVSTLLYSSYAAAYETAFAEEAQSTPASRTSNIPDLRG
jgi:hypothetical protein